MGIAGFPSWPSGIGVQYNNWRLAGRRDRSIYSLNMCSPSKVIIWETQTVWGASFLFLGVGRLGQVNYLLLFYAFIIKMKSIYHTIELHICEDKQQNLESHWFVFSIGCNLMQIFCWIPKWASFSILYKNKFLFLHCLAGIWKQLKEEFNWLNHTV